MKLNEPIYAIIDPATQKVLGDGECAALHSMPPGLEDIEWVKKYCSCPQAVVARMLTHLPDVTPVEEDGDEVFTPMPTTCKRIVPTGYTVNGERECGGRIVSHGGFMACQRCGTSYGAEK